MDLQTVLTALRNADAAGDTQAAQRLARIAQSMQSSTQEDAIESRLKQLYAEREELLKPKPTIGGNVKEMFKGMVPGAIGLAETAGTGIASMLPDDTEKAAREKIKELAGIAKKPFEAGAGYEDSVGRKLGEGLGSMLAVAPLAFMGPVGVAGGIGVGVAAGAGEARERAERENATTGQRGTATALGTIPGAFDTAIDMALAAFPGGAGKAIGFIRRALISGGVEGATEAAQAIAQNAIAKGVYKPDESLITGAGEAGAMGAGVGTIASLILDMAIPGRRRGAPEAAPEAAPKNETKAPGQQLLGYTPELFTPVAMPDGSVITNKADYDRYVASKEGTTRQRQEDQRTSDPMAGVPSDMRNLARSGKEAALAETFGQTQEPGQLGLPGIERADGTVEVPGRGRVAPKTAEEVKAAEEAAPTRDTQTRDLIDELEAQQVEELYAKDERETAKVRAEKERLKFESDLAELTGRVERKREKTTEDTRLQLLLPIVESDVKNIPKAFVLELERKGITNTNLTEREQKLINRAYDIRLAEEPVVEKAPEATKSTKWQDDPEARALVSEMGATPEPAPTDNAKLESLIAEKKTQRVQEQPSFPGMGKPKGAAPQAFSDEELASQEKPFATVLTPEVLANAGLPKQSGFYKQLLNMDMADATQQPAIANIFGRIRENPNLSASTKDAVENLAMQAFGGLAKQGEMYGPRGGVLTTGKGDTKNAPTKPTAGKPAEQGRSKNAGDGAGGTGTRAEDRKPSGAKDERTGDSADTKRTEAPKPAGLGDSGKPAGDTGTRKSVESGALKKAEPKAEPKIERKTNAETKTTYRVTYDGKPATVTIIRSTEDPTKIVDVKVKADGDRFSSLNLGSQGVVTDEKMLDNLVATDIIDAKTEPKTEPKTESKAEPKAEPKAAPKPKVEASFGAYGQVVEAASRSEALDYLAYDMYIAMFEKLKLLTRVGTLNDITAQLRSGNLPGEISFGREGTTSIVPLSGGKYAKAFYESLSVADKKALANKMLDYFTTSETEVRRGSTQFNVQQALSRAVVEQMDTDQKYLVRDAIALGMPLHPAVRKALKAGDLREALTMLGLQNLGHASEVATKLAGAIGKTKVKFASGLRNSEGAPVAGLYDPQTDTITLDADAGMNAHVLLHEAVHAATSHVIANKSHPVTKQLTELYNNVKDSLDTAYGAQSLDEFVAESFSNPEFQQKLAAINPKGEAITAWQRFMHAIRNFVRSLMGKGTKGLGTALDASDSLINAILSPAPNSRDAGSLFSASLLGRGSAVFKTLDDRILSMPALDNKIVGGIYELFREGVPSAVKKMVLRSLPLNALTEVAAKDIPMAPKLDDLEKRWGGAIDKRKRAAEATMKRIQNWTKGNPEKEVILNDVIATSTLEQVDPSKSRDSYKGKQSESGTDKQVMWDKLQPEWNKLGPEGQSVYKQMRDTYAKTYEDLLDLMFSRIDNSVENKEDAKKLKTEIYQRLATKGKIEPYFPLTRNGDYRLSYDAKGRDGNLEHFVEHYETSVERERAIKELEKESGAKNIQRFTGGAKKTYKDAPPTSFVNSILRTLEANKVDPEVTDEIMRTFLSTLPESSFAQAFRKRKNTPGFSFDATSAFFTRSMGMAHQLANLEYSGKMYQLRDEIDKHVKENNNTERARAMADELNSHIQTLVSPNISPWSKALTSTAFSWTLGFNVSSALVNMSQVPLVMMPYLGGKYGYPETTRAIGSATRLFFGSGLKRNAEMTVPTADGKSKIEVKAGFSLDNYDFDAKGVPENVKRLKELSQVAEDYGLLSRSMTHDILDMDEKSTPLNRVNAWSGFIFHHGERMNRQISLIASYELELDRMKKDGEKIDSASRTEAAKRAVQISEVMNGGASAGSAPLLAKNSIGKIMFMYKRYGVTMYYMMFKTAREAMKSEDKKVREAAMRQIVGVYASAGVMAGVQGLPMFGIMAAVYNMFKGDDEDDAETAARKYLGEGLFNGAVNYLTGTAVANRIGLSDLLINSTGYREQDNAVLAFLQLMGGPVYGVADRLQQGVKLINEGETERGLERMLPAGIANGLKGIRFANEGANTLRGDPIVGDISAYNAGAQFLGFAPAEYTRQLEINASLKNVERRATKERTKMLRDYYIAARSGDSDGMGDAIDDMLKFNKSHPSAAITAETIQNSMAQHMKTSQEMYHGVTLNKKLRSELLQNASEYDDGLLD